MSNRPIARAGIVLAAFMASGQAAPSQPPPKPQLRITRPGTGAGTLVTEYWDIGSGRTVLVKTGTSGEKAKQWLDDLKKLDGLALGVGESRILEWLQTNRIHGLLGATRLFVGEAVATVSLGPLPTLPPDAPTLQVSDPGSAAKIMVTATSDTQAWLSAVRAAKTPQDLEILLSDNHKSGLISAHTMLMGFGPVSVSWRVRSNE